MRIIETNLYKYEELSPEAQGNARDWWRKCDDESGNNWWREHVIDDAATVADILGIDLRQTRKTRGDGSHHYVPTIYWRGFYSQGDGACFECRYAYAEAAVEKIKEYAPNDADLYSIANSLNEIQSRYRNLLSATSKHQGHYYHSGCMYVEVTSEYYNDEDELVEPSQDDEEAITQLLRDFADWIYERIEGAYEYHMSDENVAESIIANEYEFTEDGEFHY